MSKKKNDKRAKLNRRGIFLIVALAVLILVVNVITLSYSWFKPVSVKGSGLTFEDTSNLRSEDCSISTYTGSVKTEKSGSAYIGQVVYDNSSTPEMVSIASGATVYFKTNITNNSEDYPSVVSLYITSMPEGVTVACTYPSNTVRTVASGNGADYYIMRNAYVKVKDVNDADGPGLLPVEWFVRNDTESTVNVDISGLYLMYN